MMATRLYLSRNEFGQGEGVWSVLAHGPEEVFDALCYCHAVRRHP